MIELYFTLMVIGKIVGALISFAVLGWFAYMIATDKY